MDITKDLLIFHNFEYDYDSGFGDFESMDVFTKTVGPINHTFTITINNGHTNMIGRDWNCIIQNDDMETVASVEVQTSGQLNKLFDLMNINLSL